MSFKKELPGTDCVFQPDDIDDYSNDAWDVRVSIGDAPLEEAFYYTIDDPSAINMTIDQLLRTHALNPANAGKLDIADYPDLPYIQTELNLYLENSRKKLLDVDFYINHFPEPGAIDVHKRAKDFLSVCTYHDGSHDYRVLDLVLLANPPEIRRYQMDDIQRNYGYIFLLLLLDYNERQGVEAFNSFLNTKVMKNFIEGKYGSDHPKVISSMRSLELKRYIKNNSKHSAEKNAVAIEITDEGRKEIEILRKECVEITELYDCYDSVSIAPPALGVPGGFDARVQMIELDGRKIERSVLVRVLHDFGDTYFGSDWAERYEDLSFYNNVIDALAYKTNFSMEVLLSLKELAEGSM